MFCKNCGSQIPDNAPACPSCGASALAVSPAAVAVDKAKAASKDALQAFRIFVSNPVGGLSVAFDALGPVRSLGAGITFGVVFALCIVLAAYRVLPAWGRPPGFSGFLKILVVSVVPFVSLLGACIAVRKAFRGAGLWGHDCFIAGATLLPFGFLALLAAVLGILNAEVITALALFAASLTILMLFAGLTRICKMSERASTLAVPLMLIASAWLSKVIYAALLKGL